MSESVLNRVREISKSYISKHLYESGLYWADKAASLSQNQPTDVHHLAQCMFHLRQFERASLLITRHQLHLKHSSFRYLAAKCYIEAKQWQAALELLESHDAKTVQSESIDGLPNDKEMTSSLHLLRGKVYEAMEIRDAATECYKEALKTDVFCCEAFDRLVAHHCMQAEEEQDLLDSLPMTKQCASQEEQRLLRFLYEMKLKKYNKPALFEIPESADDLHENLDVATSLAERHYYNCEFRSSHKITRGILKSDPFHPACLPLHVALLVELKEANKLFYLAHQLVARYPDSPTSWYAVGCYYLLQPKKQELARRYLLKATLLNRMYGPAWLAYGHSFASQNEHDQAMAAYFTASQLMKGCHLPFLYIGLEYSVTNNTKLAEKFFLSSLEISPEDPHVLHEMGVAAYTNHNYENALEYFNKALDHVTSLGAEIHIEEWEPLLNNLGHVHRKLKNFSKSLEFHRQALMLAPHSAETYSAIGFVHSYLGNYLEAIEFLHKSLGLRRDDTFTSRLLESVIDHFSKSDQPVYGDTEEVGDPPPPIAPNFSIEDSIMDATDKPAPDETTPPSGQHVGDCDVIIKESKRLFDDKPPDTPNPVRTYTGDVIVSTDDDDMDLDESMN